LLLVTVISFLISPFLISPSLAAQEVSQASVDLAQQMYVAYYGRPGDPGGVSFWAAQFEGSADLGTVLAAFGTSAEYTENFGELSEAELVTGLYRQMFNRPPEQGGLDFYVDRLVSGAATLASIAKQIADGASGNDLQTLSNKIAVANAFSEHIVENDVPYTADDISAVRALLAAVNEGQLSVSEALDEVSRFGLGTDIAPILDLLLGA
jgi:hypothetical protein